MREWSALALRSVVAPAIQVGDSLSTSRPFEFLKVPTSRQLACQLAAVCIDGNPRFCSNRRFHRHIPHAMQASKRTSSVDHSWL